MAAAAPCDDRAILEQGDGVIPSGGDRHHSLQRSLAIETDHLHRHRAMRVRAGLAVAELAEGIAAPRPDAAILAERERVVHTRCDGHDTRQSALPHRTSYRHRCVRGDEFSVAELPQPPIAPRADGAVVVEDDAVLHAAGDLLRGHANTSRTGNDERASQQSECCSTGIVA